MTDLASRLREAKEGSRELDAEIHAALFPDDAVRLIEPHPQIGPRYYVRDSSHMPAYTTDLSAAVALCDRLFPNTYLKLEKLRGGSGFAFVGDKLTPGHSLPLTLTLAILLAKEKANDRD